MKEKTWEEGAGVSTDENLSFRLSLTAGAPLTSGGWLKTVSGEAALRRWADIATRPTAGEASPPRGVAVALAEGELKANADGAVGLLDGGLEAKEKPAEDAAGPKAAELPMEKAGAVDVIEGGRAKEKPADVEAEETAAGAVGGTAKGAGAEEEAAAGGGAGLAAGVEMGRRAGKTAGAEERGARGFREGGLPKPASGGLSPSSGRSTGAVTIGLAPGLRLSREKGHRTPSVDNSSMMGAGGSVLSSDMKISCWLV